MSLPDPKQISLSEAQTMIGNYEDIRGNKAIVKSKIQAHEGFHAQFYPHHDKFPPLKESIAYLGLDTPGYLWLLLLTKETDDQIRNNTNSNPFIYGCPYVLNSPPPAPSPRHALWEQDQNTWFDEIFDTPDGMTQAFRIPPLDIHFDILMPEKNFSVYFGLRDTSQEPLVHKQIDLVFFHKDTLINMDFTTPGPPFGNPPPALI